MLLVHNPYVIAACIFESDTPTWMYLIHSVGVSVYSLAIFPRTRNSLLRTVYSFMFLVLYTTKNNFFDEKTADCCRYIDPRAGYLIPFLVSPLRRLSLVPFYFSTQSLRLSFVDFSCTTFLLSARQYQYRVKKLHTRAALTTNINFLFFFILPFAQ